jgi:hypothetical protein
VRVGEESADRIGWPLKSAQSVGHDGLDVVAVDDRGLADAVVFDVLPYPFVRMEFW